MLCNEYENVLDIDAEQHKIVTYNNEATSLNLPPSQLATTTAQARAATRRRLMTGRKQLESGEKLSKQETQAHA